MYLSRLRVFRFRVLLERIGLRTVCAVRNKRRFGVKRRFHINTVVLCSLEGPFRGLGLFSLMDDFLCVKVN